MQFRDLDLLQFSFFSWYLFFKSLRFVKVILRLRCGEGNFALYCLRAFKRCLEASGRMEGPSKLEAISILTRDPTSTNMPHSIPVLLPTNEYQVSNEKGK